MHCQSGVYRASSGRIFSVAAALFILFAGSAFAATGKEPTDVVSGGSVAGAAMPAIPAGMAQVADGRKTLVAYFSMGNSTRRVAEDLAWLFGADVEVVAEEKPRAMGFFGFMGAGFEATFGIPARIAAPKLDPAAYDRVIVLTPVWSWSLSPPMRAWLRLMKGKLPAAAFVTVSGDTRPDKIAAAMSAESGATPLAVAGFSDKDFSPENRDAYLGKVGAIVEKLRAAK